MRTAGVQLKKGYKKLLVTRAPLLVTKALLVVARCRTTSSLLLLVRHLAYSLLVDAWSQRAGASKTMFWEEFLLVPACQVLTTPRSIHIENFLTTQGGPLCPSTQLHAERNPCQEASALDESRHHGKNFVSSPHPASSLGRKRD